MNILVIGHEGYIGTGLAAYFRRNHRVVGWDVREDLFKLTEADLRRERIDLLVNLSVAADRQSAVYKVDEPTDIVNAQGVRHLTKLLKGTSIPFIQMSTREVLGPVYTRRDVVKTPHGYRPRLWVSETQPYAPSNFYGKSKILSEFFCESHPQSCVIRLTTCYTDYAHSAANWVVSLIRSAVQGRPVTLTQGGQQFRDPLHVDDLGRLMELVCEKQAFGQTLHAGGGESNLISLHEFVRRVDPQVKINKAPGGDFGFAFDIGKARELTGWVPEIQIRDRIPVVAENLRDNITGP